MTLKKLTSVWINCIRSFYEVMILPVSLSAFRIVYLKLIENYYQSSCMESRMVPPHYYYFFLYKTPK